jgi:hypothetical protein
MPVYPPTLLLSSTYLAQIYVFYTQAIYETKSAIRCSSYLPRYRAHVEVGGADGTRAEHLETLPCGTGNAG